MSPERATNLPKVQEPAPDLASPVSERVFEQLHIPLAQDDPFRAGLAAIVGREFPSIHLSFDRDGVPGPALRATEWQAAHFDWWSFDCEIDAAAALHLIDDANQPLPFVMEVLNRCQRAVGRRNQYSQCSAFERALRAVGAAHASPKPLVLADYRHALDVWQWVLRLDPHASMALQIAALFHDIERVVSEADERREHRAADYQAFKNAHAWRGAELTASLLSGAAVQQEVIERVAAIVSRHEERSDDEDIATLNDADGISFFSLNSRGYAAYFGPEQTRRKVAWTWNRMRPPARERLATIRLGHEIAAMLQEVKESM